MIEGNEFSELLARVRRGEPEAATELIEKYERELRIIARVKLTDPRVRRIFDSTDVCQSILFNFFIRTAAGEYEFRSSDDFVRLLATMIENKVIDYARFLRTKRRDIRRQSALPVEEFQLVRGANPAELDLENAEIIERIKERLSEEAITIWESRAGGCSWESIATRFGCKVDTIRKRYSRSMDRVLTDLGIFVPPRADR